MKSIENPKIKGFLYKYFKGEVLTDKMVQSRKEKIQFRIRVIYINLEKLP